MGKMLIQKWMRTAATAVVGVALFVGPQLAMAGDSCRRQNYSDQGYGYRSAYQYSPGYSQDYRYNGYSDSRYRDNYRNNGYPESRYYGNYRSDQVYYYGNG